jgi:hypothetical protein
MHIINQRNTMSVRVLIAWSLVPLWVVLMMHHTAPAQPVLSVNRDTKAVAITNPGGAGVPLDGYTIQSTIGSLTTNLANWTSLEDNPATAGPGWFESNPAPPNRLSELRASGSSTLAPGGSWGLGNIFAPPAPTAFGQSAEDLVFQFNDPTTQSTLTGTVSYTGSAGINNLALFVDPATGNVKMRNASPFPVEIDGYSIASASSALNSNPTLWTSLQDQPGAAGPDWFESNLSDARVSELKASGMTMFAGNSATTFDLGGLFKTAGTRDLVFEYLLPDNSQPNLGVVVYQAAPGPGGVTGDFNNNGTVDAADYVLWRNGGPLQNDPTAGVQPEDYGVWRANFGRMAGGAASAAALTGAAAVPEPATVVLLAGAVLWLAIARRSRIAP